MIIRKYGKKEGGWRFSVVRDRYKVGVCKVSRSRWEAFWNRIGFKVGNGLRVKFYTDKWCGDLSLVEDFPTLFSIANAKDA